MQDMAAFPADSWLLQDDGKQTMARIRRLSGGGMAQHGQRPRRGRLKGVGLHADCLILLQPLGGSVRQVLVSRPVGSDVMMCWWAVACKDLQASTAWLCTLLQRQVCIFQAVGKTWAVSRPCHGFAHPDRQAM